MATLSENLIALQEAKQNIKTAIENKGQDLTDVPFTEYGAKIEAIQTGGGTDMLQWKCDNMKSLYYEFHKYKGTEIPILENLDTSQVEEFSNIFSSCANLINVPLINTSNGTKFSSMFNSCKAITTIPQLDTGNGTDFSYMFNTCSQLTTIPQLDTGNGTNFGNMFTNASNLIIAPQLDTRNGTKFFAMFSTCIKLTTVPQLNTSKGTDFGMMFSNDYQLTTVSHIDIINATNVGSMFNNCKALTNLTLKNIKKSGLTIGSGTSWGHLLTVDSLINTIKELWDYSSGSTTYTLTMGDTNKAKLTDVYVKLITPTAEQIEADPYIESKMPCEVCASTDEGAMLITDYATLKKWTIA